MKLVFISLLFLAALPSCLAAAGTISFSTTLVEVEEKDYNQVVLNVARNGGTDGKIDFICTILNSTEDFHSPHKVTPSFSPGQTSSQCKFFVKGDTEPEGNETYAVQLGLISSNSAIVGASLAYIRILANDDGNGVVGFDVPNGISFQEPRTDGVAEKLQIRRRIATFGPITVQWRVVSSIANNDISPTLGSVVFQDGQDVRNLEFSVRSDILIEQDEDFEFELTSVSGGARLNTSLSNVVVRILANDIPVRFALSRIIVLENQTDVAVWIYRGLDASGTNQIGSVGRTSNVSWYLRSDGALANQDFVQASGTVVFANGDTRQMVSVRIIDDNIPEKSENFTVHLTNLSADVTLVSPSVCTIQILQSDDHIGVFGLSGDGNVTISEDGGDNVAGITIERTAGAFGMVNVTWTLTSSHGDLPSQVSPLHGTVMFGDGERQKMVNITVTEDVVPEEAFSFVLQLTSVSGGKMTNDPAGRSKKVVVEDSDAVYGVFEFSNDTYQILSLTSRPRTVNFSISRSGGNLGTVSVGYLVSYLSADGVDHTTSIGIQDSGTISFSPGQLNASVGLTIAGDGFIRADSVFRISLTSIQLLQPGNTLVPPRTPRFGLRTTLNLTVHSQYADGEIGFEETAITVTEPEDGQPKEVNLLVVRDGTFHRASLLWSIDGEETSNDLRPISGNLVFEKGDSSINITIQILPDPIPELDEVFTIQLHNVSETNQKLLPGSFELILTIERNDNAGGIFQFDHVDTTVLSEKPGSQLDVTVIRTGGDLDERWVKVETINGKDDFVSGEDVLIFDKGNRSLSTIFHVKDDDIPETNETFTFHLLPFGPSSVQGTLGDPTEFNVTIAANDDANGIIVFGNTSLSIAESLANREYAHFVLVRQRGLFGDVSVSWNVTSGPSVDISPTSGKIEFREEEQFRILEIFSLEDNIPELDENFTVTLTQAEGGAKIGDPRQAVLTIMRNDDAIEFAVPTNIRVAEGERATFTILRHGRHDDAIRVNYTTRDGSATSGDYIPVNQQVLFASGDTQKSIDVIILDDDQPETDENFTIVLTSSTGDTSIYGNSVAVVTIAASDDPNGIFHFNGSSVLNKTAIERNIVSFRVVRDRGIFGSVSVLWQVYQLFSNGSRHALISGDFEQTSGALVFQDREQAKDLELKVLSDDLAEYGEYFMVVLYNTTGGSPGPGGELSPNLTVAYIHVPTNDNPYGLFAFAPNSLDVSVAEDTKPGYGYEATTNLTVERKRGKDRDVGVSWCIYKADGAVNLGDIWDLVFLSKLQGASVVNDARKKRPNTLSNALEFTAVNNSYAVVESLSSVPTKEFTISVWLQPKAGQAGTILTKELKSGNVAYRLAIDTNVNVTLTMEMLVTGEKTVTASIDIGATILDDNWHNIMVAIGSEAGVAFYYDGDHIGTNSSITFNEIVDGEGDLYLGVSQPNVNQFEGLLQDVKIFTKTLQESEVSIIAHPVSDIKPINGYLDYPESLASRVVALTTVDNLLTEYEKVYSVILVSSRGGADIDKPSNSTARLTVLKSDNANGLFAFNSGQSRARTVSETVGNITFEIQRTLGFRGEVTVGWEIFRENGSRASDDFVQPFGSLVFADGVKQKTLTISVLNDQRPELEEKFQLRLVSAESNDGKEESTGTSGASVSPESSTVNITVDENDSPYGLLQFASEAPRTGRIAPLNGVFEKEVRESVGSFKLFIVRAQGILGDIQCSWKTAPLTAIANVDYVDNAGTVSLAAGDLSTSIDISIIDNEKPELNKTFRVELYDAKQGAEIGAGGVAVVLIQPSDDAFGVVNFTSSSLLRSVVEGQTVDLELQRSGGSLGDIVIGWEALDADGDLIPTSGEVLMRAGEKKASFSFVARDDLLPELTESYLVRLVNLSRGRFASRGVISNVTVLANDDPYGVFEFEPSVLAVDEASKNITIHIVRRQGNVGRTRVYYTSVPRNVTVDDVMYDRADQGQDYRSVSGLVDFQPNQTSGTFVVTIMDDVIPEDNETIVINITSVTLLASEDSQSAVGSPRIGRERLMQVVILRNDNASGIVHLSSSAVAVNEDTRGAFVDIVRSGGIFGEITVDIEVTPTTTDATKDYSINASKVTLSDGQRTAAVPISIVDDDDPEFNETFVVRLVSNDGSVIIGFPSQCEVTIEENDYPYGLIGFSTSSLNLFVSEPSSGNQVVKLHVVREYGTLGVVRFAWEVTLSGRLATSDVQHTQGTGLIPPGENRTTFEIVILADNVPEVSEVLSVTLSITQGKAALNPARSQANVTINLNDEAHGVVEFSQDNYIVQEEDYNTTARIQVVRKRGTHGDLKVYYSTLQDLSSSSAIPNQDYIPVVNASINIAGGTNTSFVDVVILGDVTPELRKYFIVELERVELLGTGVSSRPRLGARSTANVTIEDDDHVYGLFKVFAGGNQSEVVVNETAGLAVNLEIRRLGGATGDVTVMAIISRESTATENQDFRGSDVTFNFNHGDRTKYFTLSIISDDIPERDESIIVKLVSPAGGASVAQGTGNNVTVIIQANDVVAGYVGFSMLSQAVVVREGEMVDLKVTRTSPAAGMVTVDWFIQGENITKDFNETSGTVVFKEGQNSTYIRTLVLADNTSEVDEQFQVILGNPTTSGISRTGAAEINARMGSATVTVAASNEPHGVFEFQQSSRWVTVRENENIVELSVARLFGNIGTIRLHFTIMNGTLHSLTSDERLAAIGTDVAVNTTSILIQNGVSVGAIPVGIVNDNLAELDEYFIVNITSVELVNWSPDSINNETFTPPRLGRYLTSEVEIEKNDGPQGILVFSPARVNVPENITSFNLTVLRTQGTFGEVEVSYFIRRIDPIGENDFSVYGNLEMGGQRTLKYLVGQRTQNITIFIEDDEIPEGNELFEVRLTGPRGGAQLGLDSIAYVTILVNDAGNGIFRFSEGSLGMTVDEPGSRHVGTTRASFTVVRENGTIGAVVIGWSIANISASLDFKTVNGTVVFRDGERRRSFVVETVVDTVPEKEERFLVVLSVVSGGGDLTSPSQSWLTVSENDEPYGELGFAVAPQTLNIEETIGNTEIKVLRRKGNYGTVAVNYRTISQTADSSEGPVMRFGVFQSFHTRNARIWYSFVAYGKQYLLLGTGNTSSGILGNDDAYVGSGLYCWQGVYTHVTNVSTNNPVHFESFYINGQYYIAVANQGSENNFEVDSTIYEMFENGTVSYHQDIPTQAASDTKFFKPQGSSDSYLIFANMKDNAGNTAILSKVYKWSNGRFIEDGAGLNCRGASGLALFTLNNQDFLAVSSYYDSVNLNYQSKSVIFEWRNNRFELVQEITTNGAKGVEYFMLDGDHFLLFVNSRSSLELYKWRARIFVKHRDVPITNAKSAKVFLMDGKAFLVSTSSDGSSQLLEWDSQTSNFQFYANVTEYGTEDVQPITVQDSVNHNETLLAVAMTATSQSRLLQPAMVSAQADFIPRRGQLSFNNGDTELSFYVTILNDSISEPDETFMVALSNATGGSVIGPNGNLEVNILSNGNPYGRIEFAMNSGYKVVEERSRDWVLYLEVLREQGNYGEVIVAWNSTGNASESGRHGDDDVYPASGEVVFLEGETRKTINLTIVADDIPEVNEVFIVSLTSLIKDGSDLPNQGATINIAQSTSTVIIRANDEPHGIVGWQRTVALAQESEATNSTVEMVIERQRGIIGDIKVWCNTVQAISNGSANERPAVPNQDFIPVSSEVVIPDGVNMTNISVDVIHDDNAEINEVFYVNITAVQLLDSYSLPPDNSPRINPSSQMAKVVISENDNRRGELNFNISHLVDPRTGIIKVNEDIGVLRVHVVRTGGRYGTVGFEYRLVPYTVNDNDYTPTKGEVIFQANETTRVLVINITDDDTAEVSERFRLEMTQPIGGAKLGANREVTVEIRASDQPYGVFEFSNPQTVLLEEGREIRLTVVRLQGSFREVQVSWNVSVDAFPDIYPANGTLTFHNNVTSQVIRIRARNDDIPEGDKLYLCYLVSADNGGVIGSERQVRIRIDANDDGYGIMAVDAATSLVFVGEPDLPSYNGEVVVSIIRNAGTYGEVPVDWELTSDDHVSGLVAETFNVTKGTLLFGDGVRVRNITLKVKQDPYPEETTNYTLHIVGTGDAKIDQSASQASIVVVSSDYPYGIIDFDGATSYNVSEDVGHVTLNVVRNKGHTGRLLVTINVGSFGATEGVDFEVSPKVLTIEDKKDYGSINVSILSEALPELSESFSVSLGNIDLVTSRYINYGYMNGLQVDMPPEVGGRNRVVFTILKNDDAHGVVEFRKSRLVVHEHDREVVVSVLRTGGSFGVIQARYRVTNITAQYGEDYIFADGQIVFNNGQDIANLTIPLLDDDIPEDRESFRLELTAVDGDARLGERNSLEIVLETSDNPEGLFGFVNRTRIVMENPSTQQILKLGVSRIGGARSFVRVNIRVFLVFPSPGVVTADVHPTARELTYQVGEFGPKICELSILPYLEQREVEEHFQISITEVSGNASIDSLAQNVTVVILKHGMPNGLFGFASGSTQAVSEDITGNVVLTVDRKEGRKGTVEVRWAVLDYDRSNLDFVDNEGMLVFLPDERSKQISLTVVKDKLPELSEKFTVSLLSANSGGDIDQSSSNATVIIRASDNPHGSFRIGSNTQHITVENDLSRVLRFTIQRTGGTFGDVRVNYRLVYSRNYPDTLNGFVVIRDGESDKTQSVVLDENTFMYPSSHFTLTLSQVTYQGSGVSEIPPSLISSGSTENIAVPNLAANSLMKFKDGYTSLTVNQDNQVPRVIVTRDGLYGNVTVSIASGYSGDEYAGFTEGEVEPSVSTLTFNENDRELEFSVQVTPVLVPRRKMVYAVYLSSVATPRNVRGGARINETAQTSIIEPGGVFVVAMETQDVVVRENDTASLTVYRLFSTLGTIRVEYSTQRSSTALPNQDYVDTSSTLTMVDGEYRKEIRVGIINDDLPELDEIFSVQLINVTGVNARLGSNRTSTITIKDDDSPHGIISFASNSVSVLENVTVLNVIVSRTGGTFGDVGVLVRTIGGGESWTSGAGKDIKDLLGERERSKIASIGDDYYALSTTLTFNNEVPTPHGGQNRTVQLRIINDNDPEVEEDIYIYLSRPTGGAILANPSTEGQSWAVVKIEGNDLLNGRIYFEKNSLTLDEDKNPSGEIQVKRTHSLEEAKVKWEAFDSEDNLEKTSGVITFAADQATAIVRLKLIEDNDPELQSNFTVKLVSLVDTPEAVIDPTANVVTVTVLASDDPAGLIAFDPDSRNMAVDVASNSLELDVTRTQGTHGRITVSYVTTMLPEKYTDNDLVINRAIENKDYSTTQGVLVFEHGKRKSDQEIVIQLTPNTASDTSYPKAFNVTLFNITSGARLDEEYSKTMVIISNNGPTTQFLKLRSNALKTPLSNDDMIKILQSLFSTLKQQTLTASHVVITADVLNTILDDLGQRSDEKERILTTELSDMFMNVFDALLDPGRDDFRGKSKFTEPFVKYAFALLHGEPCPGNVVKKTGKYAIVEGRRRHEKDINNLIIKSSSSKSFFTYPSNIYRPTNSVGQSMKCGDVHFIEYLTTHWFNKDDNDDILNERVLSTSVKNSSETNPLQGPSYYRIYTGERRVTPKGAECLKWHKEAWDNTICSLKEEAEDYVECECKHFSNFAVRAQSDDRVGYEFYFYIAAFICMISFFLVVVAHHTCSLENTFSAKLLMHFFFAGFALHLLVTVAAYVSPDLTDKPEQCATLGILIHYFLLAHFCWIFVQCCNLWRILVLNDEHTDRKFILYFMLGWGIPVLFVALYVIITHALYNWDITEIYADVHSNGDMCFISNSYGALASVLGPVLLFLLAVGVVTTQAYQVTLQWKLYDDIFRGHHNIKEVMHLWIIFFAITMTWVFGGLHLAFGKLWLAIFFAIFDVFTGLYVFMVYFVLRNQCRKKYRDDAYLLHASSPSLQNPSPTDYYAERPVMYDAQSVNSVPKSELRLSPPDGNEWDELEYDGATPKGSRRGYNDFPLAEINPLYDEYHGKKLDETNDDVIEEDEEEISQDLNDLVRALKTGETLPEHDGKDEVVEMKQEPMRTDKLELRRMSIADTHV